MARQNTTTAADAMASSAAITPSREKVVSIGAGEACEGTDDGVVPNSSQAHLS